MAVWRRDEVVHMATGPCLSLGMAILSLTLFIAASASGNDIRAVAISGQPTPELIGTFGGFGVPVLNDAGEVAFVGIRQVDGFPTQGIWSEGSGELNLVAVTNNPAPGTTESYGGFRDPAINNNGQTYFSGFAGGEEGGWLKDADGSLSLVAIEGIPAPGTGGVFASFINSPQTPTLNDHGQTAFLGTSATDNTRGIWATRNGALSLVAQTTIDVPAVPEQDYLLTLSDPVINGSGATAFWSRSRGPQGFFSTIHSEGGGALAEIARTGASIPGTALTAVGFDKPVINDAGQTAFRASLSLNAGWSVWSEGTGSLTLVAKTGDAASGTTESFVTLYEPVLSNSGGTAFQGSLSNGASGIWAENSNGLELVALTGQTAPGTDGVFSLFGNEGNPVINSLGQVAFQAKVGAAHSGAPDGIWAQDSEGILRLIAYEGNTLDVGANGVPDLRIIHSLEFIASNFQETGGNADGRPSGFNDLGQVAFSASFSDGSSGIFVSNAVALNGDYNNNGIVDAADYTVWRDSLGAEGVDLAADGDRNGVVNTDDYNVWRSTFGQEVSQTSLSGVQQEAVPEPSSLLLFLGALACRVRRIRHCQ